MHEKYVLDRVYRPEAQVWSLPLRELVNMAGVHEAAGISFEARPVELWLLTSEIPVKA